MELLPIIGIALVATILVKLLQQSQHTEVAVLLGLATGVVVFILILERVATVLNLLEQLAYRANIDLMYFNTVLRIVAIAYVAQFGSQICQDAGEGAIAHKVELAGKILIMLLAIPLMLVILDSVLGLLP